MKIALFFFSTTALLFIFAKPASSYYNARYYNPPFPRDLLEAYRKRDCSPGAPSPCPPCGGSWNGYCLANVIRGSDRKHMCWEGCVDYSKEGCPGCAATGECSMASTDRCFLRSALPIATPSPPPPPGIPILTPTPTLIVTPTPIISPTPYPTLTCPRSVFASTIKLSCFDPQWLSAENHFQSLFLPQKIQVKNTVTQKGTVKPTNFLSRVLGFFFSFFR